ncbi:MAG: hypothetical protein JJV98_08580 [Desulfosarcina sp.]|nr:hypothetical protein [Desulfobacterales bacterium]
MFLIAAVFLWVMPVGCQTPGAARIGRNVPATNQIMLKPGGPHAGTFVTRDMTINYEFRVANGTLNVSGTMDLRFRDVDKLTMTLFYLDENGTVFDYFSFFTRPRLAVMGRVMDNRFNREFELPAEAAAFSIGYTGRTRATSSRSREVFRYSPL